MTPFTIDPDVARASTIDKRFYLDHDIWRLALDGVFARRWQWIGDLCDVAAPLGIPSPASTSRFIVGAQRR